MEEIEISTAHTWESKDLPIGTYFRSKNVSKGSELSENHILLKVYGQGYINILDGTKSWGSQTNFKDCYIIHKIKISIH